MFNGSSIFLGVDYLIRKFSRLSRQRGWLLAVFGALVFAACAPASHAVGADPAPSPVSVVEAIHAAWLAGDAPAMHAHVDYRYRLAESLGPLWEQAPEVDRARAVALMRGMFERTLRRNWDAYVAGRPLLYSERRAGADVAWVTARSGEDPGHRASEGARKPSFQWQYRLHRRDGVWRVTQREYSVGGVGSETGRFYPLVVRRVAGLYGRLPTLAEVNANLPSLTGTMRKRVFKIPASLHRSRP